MSTTKSFMKRSVRFFGLAVFLFLASCQEDPIEPDDRTQWLGAWTCIETEGDFAPQSYTVTFYEGTQLDQVELSGLYNTGPNFRLNANVYNNTLVIPTQTVNGITVSGDGTINGAGDRVNFQFSANDGATTDNVEGYMTR